MKKKPFIIFLISITLFFSLIISVIGGIGGYFFAQEYIDEESNEISEEKVVNRIVDEESSIISVAEQASDAVVSIVITAEVPVFENYYYNPFEGDPFFEEFYNFNVPGRRQNGTEEQQIGAGTGFLISEDGMIITNRHVVSEEEASYTVIMNDGTQVEAKVLARDTLLDIAFLQIEGSDYPFLELGSSEDIKIGQTTIAIGNALGEFSNTVSTGIISGLKRSIVAGDSLGQSQEIISNVIQTDASINFGNSGGPLLDIQGDVIGVNVAIAANSENIGFAIPIDVVKDLIQRLNEKGEIERPVLGVRYYQINEQVQEEFNLDTQYGALIRSDSADNPAVIPNSPADEAGIKEGDVILEIDGVKIEGDNTLQTLIQEKYIGDIASLKVLTERGNEIEFEVELFKF